LSIEYDRAGVDVGRIFGYFGDLMQGLEINPSAIELDDVLGVAQNLGNLEILNHFVNDERPIDLSNVFSRLRQKSVIGSSVDAEIDFIASHFFEIDLIWLRELNLDILERIVSSTNLCISDEDSLLGFILTVDWERGILVRYLKIEYLSSESVVLLFDSLTVDPLDSMIWSSLCDRLILPLSHSGRPGPPSVERTSGDGGISIEYVMNDDARLEGIISYLTRKHSGNVHSNGIVTITSNYPSAGNEDQSIEELAEFGRNSSFTTKAGTAHWFCWDFGELRVGLNGYTIRGCWLYSWVLEGSEDGTNWGKIDSRDHVDGFCWGNLHTASFSTASSAAYRFIRITETSRFFGIWSSVEFFGTLRV
jgi:hypothetical protein